MSPTTRDLRILVFAASGRTGSHNARLAAAAERALTRADVDTTAVNLRDFSVPPYDADLQAAEGVPAAAHRLAGLLREHDGFVLASPEYNYSMPGNLKNLIDWVSRIKPWATIGVNGLLMAASTGAVGGHRGLLALRVPLEGMGARLYPQMFTLAHAEGAFDEDGDLTDPATEARLDELVAQFLTVVAATAAPRQPVAI